MSADFINHKLTTSAVDENGVITWSNPAVNVTINSKGEVMKDGEYVDEYYNRGSINTKHYYVTFKKGGVTTNSCSSFKTLFSRMVLGVKLGTSKTFILKDDEKGLDTLAWEKTLVYDENWYDKDHENFGKPTHQALAAMEQEAIYNWWKANKNRDFFEESGLAEIYFNNEKDSVFNVYRAATNDPKYDECSKIQEQLESKFKQEEEEMLIRLIKIRDHLWS